MVENKNEWTETSNANEHESRTYSDSEYRERCIRGRNKKISKLYEEIELLKSYNRRDREAIDENARQELEFLREKLLNNMNICESEDLRKVFVLFNNKVEYVRTISKHEFIQLIDGQEEYQMFDDVYEAFECYLKNNKLYAESASSFVDKELKWYRKSFKEMVLSLKDWKVDDNGLLTDVSW